MKLVLLFLAAFVAVAAGQSCRSQGVVDLSSCSAMCEATFCLCTFNPVNGANRCNCPDFSCTDSATSSVDDDFDFFGDADDDNTAPSVEELREELSSGNPRCEGTFNRVITSELIQCLANAASEFAVLNVNGYLNLTQAELNSVCQTTCISTVLNAMEALEARTCISPFTGRMNPVLARHFGDISVFERYDTQLNVACAQGNDNNCGLIFGTFVKFAKSPRTFTANDCMIIANSGKCLGTINAALESGKNPFGPALAIDMEAFMTSLTSTCDSMGVSGISEAASGTEAPANLASSSATTVSGVAAAVLPLVAAAILA